MEIQSFKIATPLVHNIICCLKVQNLNLKALSICNNNVCRKSFNVLAGTKISSCSSCCRKLLLKNFEIEINMSLKRKMVILLMPRYFPLRQLYSLGVKLLKIQPILLKKILHLQSYDFVLSNLRQNIAIRNLKL